MEKNMQLVRGFVIDCLTCEVDKANQSSRNLTTVLMSRPGLEVPIKRYVETLRGNVCEGRVNALLELVKDAANEGRAGRNCQMERFPKKPVATAQPARENMTKH
ncbi:hypothetical protein H0O01_04850 [Candidatus Micrarchaeota archaeon]|nr:hypothetical protein [Candidatus Micrarchaeota archaeon]